MPDEALNDYLSLPLCPDCDGFGEEPEEVLFGNTVAVVAVPCRRCGGLRRVLPGSRAEADMLAAVNYADATYEEAGAWHSS